MPVGLAVEQVFYFPIGSSGRKSKTGLLLPLIDRKNVCLLSASLAWETSFSLLPSNFRIHIHIPSGLAAS